MSSTDQYKTDTDVIQQIQSIGSIKKAKNCLNINMFSMWAGPDQYWADLDVFGMKEGPK
jgi:hypothetical protein